jgi:hypothetical protein
MGSLQHILPGPIPEVLETAFLVKLRSKILTGATKLVTAVRAIQTIYGNEGVEAIHQSFKGLAVETGKKMAREANASSLRAFCSALETRCTGSHEWLKLEDTDVQQVYRFTRCMLAEVFTELDAQDIGFWLCDGDGPMATAFNPAIGFQRTKTLMRGDNCCDHIFYIKNEV